MNFSGNFHGLIIRANDFTSEETNIIKEAYNHYGREKMFSHFKEKKILPFAAKSFCELNIDPVFWGPILEEYRKRNLKIIGFLDSAYAAMESYGVKKVFLSENFGALLTSNGDIGLFASGDTDNCYDPEEKDKIYESLQSIGCTFRESYAVKRLNSSVWYPPKSYDLPDSFYMGLQPKPLSRLYLPSFVDMKDFDGWSNMGYYGKTHIHIPDPTVLMYICMLHVSLHSFSRAPDIRLYTDLLNMSRMPIDYEKIVFWCKKNDTRTRVSVAASISNILMGTHIPDCVTSQTKRAQAVLDLVVDSRKKELKYEPQGLKILEIEAKCDDKSSFAGLLNICFPCKEWMIQTYGGSNILSYIKHIKRIA